MGKVKYGGEGAKRYEDYVIDGKKKRGRVAAVVVGICVVVLLIAGMVAFGMHNYIGRGLEWSLENGVLTISGEGAMAEKANKSWVSEMPWYGISDEVKHIVIEDGVTSISKNAFSICSEAESVRIAGSVESIGDFAFWYCTSLKSVEIPEGVVSLGRMAFGSCDSLTSVKLPMSLQSADGAFVISNALTSVGPTGSGCDFEFAWTESIPNGVFSSCRGVTSVTLPKGMAKIGSGAFSDCASLSDVYYDGSSEEWEQMTIEENNSSLTGAVIHYSEEEIEGDGTDVEF